MTTNFKNILSIALMAMCGLSLVACGDDEAKENNSNGGNFDTSNTGTISISPGVVEFVSTEIGGQDLQSILVTNTGRGQLRVSKVTLTEDNADNNREFFPGEGWESSFNLAPNESKELLLVWKPLDTTTDSGTLVFESNDPTSRNFTVNVNTPKLAPQIISPAVVQFPRVAAGTKQSQLTFIQNGGQAALQLKDIFIELGGKGFEVSFPDASNPSDPALDSTDWKRSLAPNEQIPVRVSFAPSDDNPSSDKIIVRSNDPDEDNYEIRLLGNAGTPCIQLVGVSEVATPAGDETHELNFGLSAIGNASNKTVQIQNCSRTEQLNVKSIIMTDDGGGVFAIKTDALPMGVNEPSGAVIEPNQSAAFVVTYTPGKEEANTGRLIVESDDPVNSELRINALGVGSNNACPVARAEGTIVGGTGRPANAIDTIPLKTIQLSGLGSSDTDGQVETYSWSLIKKPTDSTTRLSPSDAIAEPKLFLDLAGEYIVELTVYDKQGLASCDTSRVTILSNPDEDIHVQLVWNNDNTDLDMHYLSPRGKWDLPPYDIFWRNPTADWGVTGNSADDPSLDIDDTDGFGPENVNHDRPVSGENYRVGVHYFADNGRGSSYATIRIYLEGALKVELRDQFLEKEGAFWDVGFITWPEKQFGRIDRIYNGFPGQ